MRCFCRVEIINEPISLKIICQTQYFLVLIGFYIESRLILRYPQKCDKRDVERSRQLTVFSHGKDTFRGEYERRYTGL